jgi:hypothetical protein
VPTLNSVMRYTKNGSLNSDQIKKKDNMQFEFIVSTREEPTQPAVPSRSAELQTK